MHSTIIVPPEVPPGTILACSRCGHKWAIRKKGALPKNCPECRSTLWMKKYYRYTCMKCGHQWGTANDSPLRCPKCHTSKWNVPQTPKNRKSKPVRSRLPRQLKAEICGAYGEGLGCLAVAGRLNLAFGDVMDVLLEAYPGEKIRI